MKTGNLQDLVILCKKGSCYCFWFTVVSLMAIQHKVTICWTIWVLCVDKQKLCFPYRECLFSSKFIVSKHKWSYPPSEWFGCCSRYLVYCKIKWSFVLIGSHVFNLFNTILASEQVCLIAGVGILQYLVWYLGICY